ncbi:MAG: Ku protein [Enhydrobacter sp.]|nr:MAG: Ku protein [Enhydrobacter sp.]
MAVRPTWEGHLRLSLVTCPVALYKATDPKGDLHFNLINPRTNNRVRQRLVDAGTGEDVERRELVKGFAVAKDRYVLLDKDDFEAVKLESTRVIDIEEFVPVASIDRLYWDEPYFLVPAGKTGIEAFAVIRAAMERSQMVAIGRLVMSTRERLCALEPRGEALLLTTLRMHDEVRGEKAIPHADLPKADRRMLEIAEKIIEQQKGDFDPSHFNDRYEDALREVIERKKKGKPVRPTMPDETEDKVVDLMAALRQSLKGSGAKRERAERFVAAKSSRSRGRRSTSRRKASGGRRRAA